LRSRQRKNDTIETKVFVRHCRAVGDTSDRSSADARCDDVERDLREIGSLKWRSMSSELDEAARDQSFRRDSRVVSRNRATLGADRAARKSAEQRSTSSATRSPSRDAGRRSVVRRKPHASGVATRDVQSAAATFTS